MPLPSRISESVRRLNPHLFGGPATSTPDTGDRKRLRQSDKPVLNILEQEFFDTYLSPPACSLLVYPQGIRLELARGHWFKPDFFVPGTPEQPTAFETKGPHAFRGGFENLKVAARVHPWCKFVLCWKEGCEWKQQIVLP